MYKLMLLCAVLMMPGCEKKSDPADDRPKPGTEKKEAAVDNSSLDTYKCKAKQTEAREFLTTIKLKQMVFLEEPRIDNTGAIKEAAYASTLEELDWKAKPGSLYDYKIVKADKESFVAEATGKADTPMAGDHWIIDQAGKLEAKKNICQK